MAIEFQKDVNTGEGNTFVAIDETVVHRETFPQSGSFFDGAFVVTRLRSEHSSFDQTDVTNTRCTAKKPQLLIVNVQDV